MPLKVQIDTIILSFIYGLFVSLIFNFFRKKDYTKSIKIRIIVTFIITIFLYTMFFQLLVKINSGIVNYYLFLFLFLGFIIGNRLICKIKST